MGLAVDVELVAFGGRDILFDGSDLLFESHDLVLERTQLFHVHLEELLLQLLLVEDFYVVL